MLVFPSFICGPCNQEDSTLLLTSGATTAMKDCAQLVLIIIKKFKSTRDHKNISIENYKFPIGFIKTECDKHNQQSNLYCPSHLMPCCDKCISNHHSKWTGIRSLTAVVEKNNIENSKESDSVVKDINYILLFSNEMANKKSSNIKKGEKQYENIKEFINKISGGNQSTLRPSRKEVMQRGRLCSRKNPNWQVLLLKLKKKRKKMKEMQDDLQTFTVHTSKLQSFLGLHQIGEEVHQCQWYLNKIENNERAWEVEIKIKKNDDLENCYANYNHLDPLEKWKSLKLILPWIEKQVQAGKHR